MKYATIFLRILLGVPFLVFGLNKFFGFIETPPMEGLPGEFMSILYVSGYLKVIGAIEIFSGLLLLTPFFTPLALVAIFPVNVNIILFHTLLTGGEEIGLGLLLTIINIVLMFAYLPNFKPLIAKSKLQSTS